MGWYRWTDSVSYIFGAYRFWPRLPTCQTVWIQMNVSVHSFRFPWHQFQMRVNAMNRSARYTCRAAPRCTYNVTWASVCIPVFNYTICNIVIGIWHIHMKKKLIQLKRFDYGAFFRRINWFGLDFARFYYAHACAHLSLFFSFCVLIYKYVVFFHRFHRPIRIFCDERSSNSIRTLRWHLRITRAITTTNFIIKSMRRKLKINE